MTERVVLDARSRGAVAAVLTTMLTLSCARVEEPEPVAPATAGGGQRAATGVVTGYTVAGGEVLEVTTSDGTKVYPATLAQLSGSVFDSTKAGPLSLAMVTVSGTDFFSLTDDSGSFRLAVPLDGAYEIAVTHPHLDSLGIRSVLDTVQLARNETSAVSIVTPGTETIVARLCGDSVIRADRQVVVGAVTDSEGTAVPGARVRVGWQQVIPVDSVLVPQEFWHTVIADETGVYTVCGLHKGRRVVLSAEQSDRRSKRASVIFPWTADGRVLLSWDRPAGASYEDDFAAPFPVWRLDLSLGQDAAPVWSGGTRIVTGIVADRMTGQGLGGVLVSLNQTDTTTTRNDGTFDIVDANWIVGENVASFRRLGYEPWTQRLRFNPDQPEVALSPLMLPTAIALDPVYVEAARVRRAQHLEDVGFYRREGAGFGFHMGPDEIDLRRASANTVLDFMTGIPGVQTAAPMDAAGSVGQDMLVLRASFRECVPKVYVDELEIPDGAYVSSLSQVVRPEEVEAIEIYKRGTETPLRYGHACVVLIWTIRGTR